MKIDFIGQKMAIEFDKVPRFLYFNEDAKGCGAVFLDGQRVKKLKSLRMESISSVDKFVPLKYSITHYNSEDGKFPMEETIGNMLPPIEIGVKLLDLCKFKDVLDIINNFAFDERIPAEVRQEFVNKITKAMEGQNENR